ncbi:hypothetical protein ACHQM5_003570 [Ranunculus cassubicifolius]
MCSAGEVCGKSQVFLFEYPSTYGTSASINLVPLLTLPIISTQTSRFTVCQGFCHARQIQARETKHAYVSRIFFHERLIWSLQSSTEG